jgi:branched-chain amino acid transport system permease protein
MRHFVERHTFWAIVILLTLITLLWMIFAVWPEWLIDTLGRKKTFVITLLNGITVGGLYFLVASGFTLVFGLMRNVNLAHGSMYLLGGYIGFEVAEYTGNWFMGLVAAFFAVAISGVLMQVLIFRRMEGDDLRQTLVTIGISIIAADAMLAIWTGATYQFSPPDWLFGAAVLPIISVIKSSGAVVFIKYPVYRLAVLAVAVAIGVSLWLFLNRTKIGMMIRAGVNDREMLAASGINVQLVFVVVFALGAGLAGFAGVIGGTALSIAPGEDIRYLLASLVVVIVGGMGSISGAAIGALIIGLAEQFGLAYFPTYGVVLTFVIMVVVLAVRPQGLMGERQ